MSDWTFVSLGNLIAQFPQNRDQGDQGQADDGGLVAGFNFLKQCDAAGLDLVAAGAIERADRLRRSARFRVERAVACAGWPRRCGASVRSAVSTTSAVMSSCVWPDSDASWSIARSTVIGLLKTWPWNERTWSAPMIVAPGLCALRLAALTRASVSAKRKGFDSVDFSTDSSQTGEHARNAIPRRSRSARRYRDVLARISSGGLGTIGRLAEPELVIDG